MKSRQFFTIVFLSIQFSVFAQQPQEKRLYYDWAETKLKAVYTVLPDGTEHGPYKVYYENGNLQISGLILHGIPREFIGYLPDGKIFLNTRFNENKLFEGKQESYGFDDNMQNRFLKQTANIANGTISLFKTFNPDGTLSWSYEEAEGKKTYKEYENNTPKVELRIENNHLSGFINNGITISDNEITSLNQEGVTGRIEGRLLYVEDSEWQTYYNKENDKPLELKVELPSNIDNVGNNGLTFGIRLSLVSTDSEAEVICSNSYENDRKLNNLEAIPIYLIEQYVQDSLAVKKVDGMVEVENYIQDGKVIGIKEFKGKNGQLSFEYKDDVKNWYNDDKRLERQEVYSGDQLVSIKKFLGKDGQLSYEFTGNIESWYNDLNQLERQDIHKDAEGPVVSTKVFKNGFISYHDTIVTNCKIDGNLHDMIKKVQYFDDSGRITKEEVNLLTGKNLKYKIFNTDGEIIDSDDLRIEYENLKKELSSSANSLSGQYQLALTSMAEWFSLDKNGQLITGKTTQPSTDYKDLTPKSDILSNAYNNVNVVINPDAFNRKNRNIYDGVQILYNEFLGSVLDYDNIIIEKYNNTDYVNSISTYPEKINYYKEYKILLMSLDEQISNFQAMMKKVNEIASGPEASDIDKNLKKVTDPQTIKSIMGLI